MPRYKLIEARQRAELSQSGLAGLVGAERKAVNRWERGEQEPRDFYRQEIRKKLNNQDSELFTNYPEGQPPHDDTEKAAVSSPCQGDNCPQVPNLQQLPVPCQQEPNRAMVETADPPPFVMHIPRSVRGFGEFMDIVRRQFIEIVAKLGLTAPFANLSLGLVSSPTVDPEEYLSLAGVSIGTWWQWLYQGNHHELERVLLTNAPILKRLANTFSPFQGMAANLAAQAKFMQIILDTHRLDYGIRETHCVEAVRFGELSSNRDMLVSALFWQGGTYIYCYRQPETAIPILNNALAHLGSDALLSRSAICTDLSIAYAQQGDEIGAMKHAEMARNAMSQASELDPLRQCIMRGPAELDQLVGKVCLYLAEYFPDSDYAQLAYNAFDESMSKQAMNQALLGQTYIRKADAARALGYMDECVTCLTEGFHIGDEIKSLKRLMEASDVISNMSDAWKKETSVQDLQKDITHVIIVVRRQFC